METIAGQESSRILDYFARNGAPCPPDANPAEHIIEVVQGSGASEKTDWVEVWNRSEERQKALEELEALNQSGLADPNYVRTPPISLLLTGSSSRRLLPVSVSRFGGHRYDSFD